MRYRVIISSFIFLFILSLVTPKVVKANYFFDEEFNNSWSNIVNWNIYSNLGNLNFSSNYLEVSTNSFDLFPYVETSNIVFPDNDFSIEWRFRYISPTYDFGSGMFITDVLPINGTAQHPNRDVAIIGNWVAVNQRNVLSFALCPEDNPSCTSFSSFFSDSTEFNQFNIVKIDYIGGQYSVFYNGELKFVSAPTERKAKYIWFGNPMNPNTNVNWAEFQIDYIRVTDLSDNRLEVTNFTQNDPDWKNLEYDHAIYWNSDYPYMKNLGCAVTSAAIQLDYYGVDQLLDGTALTPQSLNEYLINVQDGYIGEGQLNWLKISSLTKQLHDLNGTPKLEWKNVSSEEFTDYETNIDDEVPEILKLSDYWQQGFDHFFVGTGYDDTNLLISDPLGKHDEISRDEEVIRRGYFFETNSDFSGMTFVTSDNIDIRVVDPNGNTIGSDGVSTYFDLESSSYIVETASFNSDEGIDDSLPQITELMITHLPIGEYHLVITASESADFVIDPFIQNLDATSRPLEKLVGHVNPGQEVVFVINYLNNDQNTISSYREPVSFASIRKFIRDEFSAGRIRKALFKQLMLIKLEIAEFMLKHHNKKVAKITFNFILFEISHADRRILDSGTAVQLKTMIVDLKTQQGL